VVGKFEPLNKKHLYDLEFNIGRIIVSFHIARTWTWDKLSPDMTEKTTNLFSFHLIQKKFKVGGGICFNIIIIPFCLYVGWCK
jgi:hypothetical protein